MQEKSDENQNFFDRTLMLARKLGVRISDLPVEIGVSSSMFHSYRSGAHPVTDRVWRMLSEAERKAGIAPRQDAGPLRERESGNSIPGASGIHLRDSDDTFGACRMIPVLGWAHAGEAENYEELPQSWQRRVPTECPDQRAFAVRLEGDSMEPRFRDGDVLIAQPSRQAYSGCFVVVRFAGDGGILFRRLEFKGRLIELVPLNDRYGVTVHEPDEFSWVYPVWGCFSQLWR